VHKLPTQIGMAVMRIADLPLPPEMAQGRLDFERPEGIQKAE